jgi:AcrR family transcriptional regulator
MPRTSDKREKLIEAASTLIHQQGYGKTSLADIAEVSGVPLGNVYYYFKTKDELADAVVRERINHMQDLFDYCEQNEDPRERLNCFLNYVVAMRDDITRYGCPIGGLCQELNKDDTGLADKADTLLGQSLKWITAQFKAMGHRDAKKLGEHFLAAMHGASLLANTFDKASIIKDEATRLRDWVARL